MIGEHEVFYRLAKEWTYQAGYMIKKMISKKINYQIKSSPVDLVTEVDQQIEQYFVQQILSHFPDHQILGEEGIAERIIDFSGYIWVIDPIDGTSNFVSQKEDFVISVALLYKEKDILGIVYDVMKDEMYHSLRGNGVYINQIQVNQINGSLELIDSLISFDFNLLTKEDINFYQKLMELNLRVRGFRSYGATALSLAKVATGKNDGYITLVTYPWDFAAGKILVKESGGVVTNFHGQYLSIQKENSIIACHPGVYDNLRYWVQHL